MGGGLRAGGRDGMELVPDQAAAAHVLVARRLGKKLWSFGGEAGAATGPTPRGRGCRPS